MINIWKKIFDEIDVPTNSRIISEDKDKSIIERESSWTGNIKGIDSFPNGTVEVRDVQLFLKMVSPYPTGKVF